MKKYNIVTLSVLMTLTITTAATASDNRSRFVSYGSGNKRCKAIGASFESIDAQIAAWMAGYVTAHNEIAKGEADIVDDKSLEPMLRLLSTYCAAHPDAKIVDAAEFTIAKKMDEARERLEKYFRSLPSSVRRTPR